MPHTADEAREAIAHVFGDAVAHVATGCPMPDGRSIGQHLNDIPVMEELIVSLATRAALNAPAVMEADYLDPDSDPLFERTEVVLRRLLPELYGVGS